MAAPQQYSGRGFILGGVTDETPDWLGSYNEGVEGAQRQTQNRLAQQQTRQTMAESAAAEQRRAIEFANQQADRARIEQSWAEEGGKLPGLQTPQGPALGPLPGLEIPAAVPPGPGLAEPGAATAPGGNGAITRDEFIKLLPEWARMEQAEGLPPNYLETISMLESSGGVNTGTGQYTGVFQIGPEVAKDFGVTPEQLRDPRINAQVAAKLAARNAKILRARLNREPQPWELYLAHQQGAGGAASLLQNPNDNAVIVLAAAYGGDRERARQAVIQNGGNPNMTAGEFAGLWAQKFGGALPQPFTGGPGVVTEGGAAPGMVATPDPNASPLRNDINEFLAKRERRDVYYGIIDNLRQSPLAGVYDYFFSDQATAEQNAAQSATKREALQWYQSDAVGTFFDSNPAALTEAQKDPLAFYQRYKDSIGGAAAAPAATGVSEKGDIQTTVPAAPAAAPATGGAGVQTSTYVPPDVASDYAIPRVSQEDYAGLAQPGQGSIAQQIMRTPAGQQTVLPDMGPYIVEPAKINADLNELTTARQTLERQYARAVRFRDLQTMAAIEGKVIELDAGIRLMQNMQAVAEMQAGDDTQVAQTLSRLTNGQLRIQPRSDGKYNVFQNGKMAYEGVPKDALIASLRLQFDQQYQAQVAEQSKALQERENKLFEGQANTQTELAKQEAQLYREMAIERIKQARPEANVNVDAATGTIVVTPKSGGRPEVFTISPDYGVDGQPLLNADGTPVMTLKQIGATNAVPVQ